MKILIIHSGNRVGGDSHKYTFVNDQAFALRNMGCDVECFAIIGHGIIGYLKNISRLQAKIKAYNPDIIHAHYGLCGLVANLSTRKIPVVTTYHGSDINLPKVRLFSQCSIWMSAWNIFVSSAIARKVRSSRASIIPCGIELPNFCEAYPSMQNVLSPDYYHVLFAGAFDNEVKDPELAKSAICNLKSKMSSNKIELIELKGYSRDEVYALMYQVDLFLLTSKTEGSPQVIKEAIACGCPIVSVDVGDVKERLQGLENCYVVESRSPETIAECIAKIINSNTTHYNGKQIILRDQLTHPQIAQRIIKIYQNILNV